MNIFTNKAKLPLSLLVWLLDDEYDHNSDPNTISVTSLLKPIKAIVLARQSKELNKISEALALLPARFGTAIHTAIENSWLRKEKWKENLSLLGEFPDKIIDRLIVNPEKKDIKEDSICVYMEIRSSKKVGKYTVSGKFDIVIDGELEDFKTTGTYSYVNDSNSSNYIHQGSIYRWLNPEIITKDTMKIQYIFTDWSALQAKQNPKYPDQKTKEKVYTLLPLDATQSFVENVIATITRLEDADQEALPECTKEELWQKPDVWKYYKNPASTTRSTKNFTSSAEAYIRLSADGNVGTVLHVPGKIMRCKYCDVMGVCEQAQGYISSGLL